jgi:hypothetical protein
LIGYTLYDSRGTIIWSAFIGFWIGLYVYVVFVYLKSLALSLLGRGRDSDDAVRMSQLRVPDLGDETLGNLQTEVRVAVDKSHGPGEMAAAIIQALIRRLVVIQPNEPSSRMTRYITERAIWRDFARNKLFIIGTIVLAIAVLFIPVGLGVVSTFSSHLFGDSTALIMSPTAGIWIPSTQALSKPYIRQRAQRAADWAFLCYDPKIPDDSCSYLYTRSLSFTETSNAQCPFQGAVCYSSESSAHRFDTLWLPLSVLGLNTKPRFEFRRIATFSPIVMSEPYITRIHGRIYYNYGSFSSPENPILPREDYPDRGPNTTWAGQDASLAVSPIASYSVSSFVYHDMRYMQLPEFKSRYSPNDSTTFMFVSPGRIYHPVLRPENVDPIFFADHPADFEQTILFTNNLAGARIMAVVEQSFVRDILSGQVWGSNNITGLVDIATAASPEALIQRFWAFYGSSIWEMVQYRGADALDAQKRLSNFISLPLDEVQWRTESRQIFKTALAAMQWTPIEIAQGTFANKTGYEEIVLAEEIRNLVAGCVKFHSRDYKNLSIFGVVLTFVVPFILFVGSLSVHDKLLVTSMSSGLAAVFMVLWRPIISALVSAGVLLLWMATNLGRLLGCNV